MAVLECSLMRSVVSLTGRRQTEMINYLRLLKTAVHSVISRRGEDGGEEPARWAVWATVLRLAVSPSPVRP